MQEPPPSPQMTVGVTAHLPSVFAQLAPELLALSVDDEPRADCSRCSLVPLRLSRPAHATVRAASHATDHPWAFHPDARCCTYHPKMANFMLGRALARDDAGARLLRQRLRAGIGVSAWGLASKYPIAAATKGVDGFGRDLTRRCPFWVGGDHACGVWRDRNGVCRTWFCRHDQGMTGAVTWMAVRRLLLHIEDRVASLLAALGAERAPAAGSADAHAWEHFYRWCAERAQHLSEHERTVIEDAALLSARARVARGAGEMAPLPEVVVPVFGGIEVAGPRIWVHGYSRYDIVELPAAALHVLAQLDGQRPWPVALENARALTGEALPERVLHDLYRIDALQAPSRVLDTAVGQGRPLPPRDPHAPIPAVLRATLGSQIAIGDSVWLQGSVPMGSTIAPRSILTLLAQLDGHAPWRACAAPDQVALVERLYRIGALHEPAHQSRGPGASQPGSGRDSKI